MNAARTQEPALSDSDAILDLSHYTVEALTIEEIEITENRAQIIEWADGECCGDFDLIRLGS